VKTRFQTLLFQIQLVPLRGGEVVGQGGWSSYARLPYDVSDVALWPGSPVTVVATQLTRGGWGGGGGGGGGGFVAAGSADGAFAVWNPTMGVVVRAAAGGWGAGGGGGGISSGEMALTALGFLSDAAVAEESSGGLDGGGGGGAEVASASASASAAAAAFAFSTLVVGGTRGGGVAAWDATTGVCVLASPGSHAGAVTAVRAAPGGAALAAGPAAGAAVGPSLALTASSSAADGCVRLWDIRMGPRGAAALTGHRGGVTALSPRMRFASGWGCTS
jgi:WD40 repeat protein